MGFDMEARINIDLVAFAVGRAITCSGCRKVLDVETAVLVQPTKHAGTTVCCSKCWSKARPLIGVEVEVTDGRTGSVTIHQPVSQVEPEQSEARIDGEQGELF